MEETAFKRFYIFKSLLIKKQAELLLGQEPDF
jgi:hypothetical protein